MSTRTYDYSPAHRACEVVGIVVLAGLVGMLFAAVANGVRNEQLLTAAYVVLGGAFVAYLAADLASGLVHFLADNFGHEEMLYLGAAFIRPFRHHHVDPKAMTRHDFIETNGNNSMICVPVAAAVYFSLSDPIPVVEAAWASFVAWLMIWVFMTNQFHKWAHLDEPAGWVRALQRSRLILSPEHHDVHHVPPFESYYCITSGWLNPIFHRIGFFTRLEAFLRWATRSPKDGAGAERISAP